MKSLDRNCSLAFLPEDDSHLIIISNEGKYYQAKFDPIKGGDCKL